MKLQKRVGKKAPHWGPKFGKETLRGGEMHLAIQEKANNAVGVLGGSLSPRTDLIEN